MNEFVKYSLFTIGRKSFFLEREKQEVLIFPYAILLLLFSQEFNFVSKAYKRTQVIFIQFGSIPQKFCEIYEKE